MPLIYWMKAAGATDREAAAHLGVTERTLQRWKQRYPQFRRAEKDGRNPSNLAVTAAAFRRAVGYDYVEETRERQPVLDAAGKPTGRHRLVVVKREHKHQPANVVAAIWWLKNRWPDEWHDRQEIKATASVVVTHEDSIDDGLRRMRDRNMRNGGNSDSTGDGPD